MKEPTEKCILFQNAFLFSSDAIILTDLKGHITDVNKAFCELFGWSRDELINQRTSILRAPGVEDSFYVNMWESIEKNGEWKGEIVNKHKSGRLIPILLSITPIYQDGEKIGFMGIEIDMTEQLKLQESMARSEKLATIGRMAAKVAHEIRNPLSSISLNAELLEDEILSSAFDVDEARSLLNSIMKEVDRLANLTNEYLQFSRMPRLQSEDHNLCQVIENLTVFIESELRNNQIELEMDLPQNPLFVQIDKDQIHRVLLNLLRNSIEALTRGGLIKISVSEKVRNVEIRISDTGPGITSEHVDKIFEPFFTTKDLGTGLGLPLSKQMIEEHGGSIKYINDSSQGAVFLINLPKNARLTERKEIVGKSF